MITTVHVQIRWAGKAPQLAENPLEHLSIKDPRVLLGVQQELARRSGVTQAPDLVSASSVPYFVVSLDDGAGTGFIPVTTLLAGLTSEVNLHIAFAADGGWKVVLAELTVEVI